jgi:hypothetical protein
LVRLEVDLALPSLYESNGNALKSVAIKSKLDRGRGHIESLVNFIKNVNSFVSICHASKSYYDYKT